MSFKKILNSLNGIEKRLLDFSNSQHVLVTGDSLEIMDVMPSESVDLILTDTLYNIGMPYRSKKFKDNKKKNDYFKWSIEWLEKCARILKKNGSMYLINYPEINAPIFTFLDENQKRLGLKFRRWITWHYPTNTGHSKKNFTRSQRSILFYTKGDKYKFYRQKILQHYKNPEVSKIKKRLKSGSRGRASYDLLRFLDLIELQKGTIDVLDINLLKNVSKDRMKYHPCQLPISLLEILIKVSSKRGDIVFDPFAGTFTTSYAAKKLGRNSVGIDIEPKFVKMGLKRLK